MYGGCIQAGDCDEQVMVTKEGKENTVHISSTEVSEHESSDRYYAVRSTHARYQQFNLH